MPSPGGGFHYTETWFQSQSKSLNTLYTNADPEAPEQFSRWLNVLEDNDSERSFFQALSFYGFGMLSRKPEGGTMPIDKGGEGVPSFFPFISFGLKYGITYEGRREDPYKINARLPEFLRYSEDQTVENLVWNILNQAFNTNVPIWDGQPLCSTSHTLVGQPGVTYSNSLGSVSLTPEMLRQAFILMATLPNDRNLATYKTPRSLIVTVYQQATAEEITQSAYYPYSDENRINTSQGKVDPMVIRYLAAPANGPYPWFISAGKGAFGKDAHSSFVCFRERHNTDVWYDRDSKSLFQSTYMRLVWGSLDGRGLVGSQGA